MIIEDWKVELTHISLFAGIGGIDVAAEWAGFRIVLFVEIDSYCQKVLKKHWPNVPIIGDIKDVTKETIANTKGGRFGQEFNSITDKILPKEKTSQKLKGSSGNEYGNRKTKPSIRPITLITGGFPCQPVSVAGKRRGKEDDRWLWPEMLRVISEVRPTWVVAENVAGLLQMGFNDCISDLESEGYETIPFLIPACGVNAPHRRDRIFIVGYSKHTGWDDSQDTERLREGSDIGNGKEGQIATRQLERPDSSRRRAGDVANPSREGLQGQRFKYELQEISREEEVARSSWWAVEPQLGRVAYGIPHRVDRLKCLGNAVVPQQIYPILKAIADIENQINIGVKGK